MWIMMTVMFFLLSDPLFHLVSHQHHPSELDDEGLSVYLSTATPRLLPGTAPFCVLTNQLV